MPNYTLQTNTQGFLNVLEAARIINPETKIYQASSSEMFGNNIDSDGYQRITTPMHPVSPYGCSKLAAHTLANNYKNSYNMFIVSGVLFNHESPRRGANFVTAKVVEGAVKISKGQATELALGNLDSAIWSGDSSGSLFKKKSVIAPARISTIRTMVARRSLLV